MNKSIISENVSGYIDYKDDYFHTIWEGIDLTASITIKLNNLSNDIMVLKIESKSNHIIKIPPYEERIVTVSNVYSIAIKCNYLFPETPTYGQYQILLHYPLNFDKGKKQNGICDDTFWSIIRN